MRLPLAIPLDARTGAATKDGRLTNTVVETYEGQTIVTQRPGLSQLATISGAASGVVCFNDSLVAISGTSIYRGDVSKTPATTWSAMTVSASKPWKYTKYGGGTFISVAKEIDNSDTAITTSTNGTSWTSRTFPSAATCAGIAYGNGRFVAVRTNNITVSTKGAVSTNGGVSWAENAMPYFSSWAGIEYGAGLFVALVGTSDYATSPDGVTWTLRTFPVSALWRYIAYGNGIFVAASTANHVATSPDGITWTTGTRTAGGELPIVFGNGVFLMAGSESGGIISTDGLSWSSFSTQMFEQTAVVSHETGFIISGQSAEDVHGIILSETGAAWTAATTIVTPPGLLSWLSGASGGGVAVFLGNGSVGDATVGAVTALSLVSLVGTLVAGQYDFAQSTV